jgi:hypothetical protein
LIGSAEPCGTREGKTPEAEGERERSEGRSPRDSWWLSAAALRKARRPRRREPQTCREWCVRQLAGLPVDALLDVGDFVGAALEYLRRHPVDRLPIAAGSRSCPSSPTAEAVRREVLQVLAEARVIEGAREEGPGLIGSAEPRRKDSGG